MKKIDENESGGFGGFVDKIKSPNNVGIAIAVILFVIIVASLF